MLPTAAELVACFLKANGYTETLSNFINEAGLPSDIGTASDGKITIETILHEKKTFDLSLSFEKLGIDEEDQGWSVLAPAKSNVIECLPNRSNILGVFVLDLLLPSANAVRQYVAVTTADRQIHIMELITSGFRLVQSISNFQDSPSLDIVALGSRHLLIASMSGKLTIFNLMNGTTEDERKDHNKYVVKLAVWSSDNSCLVASAGWDAEIILYQLDLSAEVLQLGEPMATLALPSIPETMVFVASPESGTPMLLVARRDSTFLHYYATPNSRDQSFTLLGKQNLAPHSNAWVAFSPADVQICPTDPYLAAVATSSTPHMRLLVVKLMLPPASTSMDLERLSSPDESVTQASQARAELATADREEAAILVNVSTLAPQTSYSTPRVVWRPDGSGVYVSSDDGVVRGIEAKTGKLMTSLEGHDPGSKLRCLWSGRLQASDPERSDPIDTGEYLVSGGFDQKLILWTHP